MPDLNVPDSVLTVQEVADYLKVAERTIYRLAAGKKIPAFKVGVSWRFSRAEIDSWIKQQSSEIMGSDQSADTAQNQTNNGMRK